MDLAYWSTASSHIAYMHLPQQSIPLGTSVHASIPLSILQLFAETGHCSCTSFALQSGYHLTYSLNGRQGIRNIEPFQWYVVTKMQFLGRSWPTAALSLALFTLKPWCGNCSVIRTTEAGAVASVTWHSLEDGDTNTIFWGFFVTTTATISKSNLIVSKAVIK